MKRKVTLWVLGILIVFIGIGVGLRFLDTQRNLTLAGADTVVASLPIVSAMPLRVEIADSLIFKIDTGTDISSITLSDLEQLKARGYNVTERNMPVIGRTSDGKLSVHLKRYIVDLPLRHITANRDSTGRRLVRKHLPENDNILKDAEFVLLEGDSATSAIGIDILQRFVLEYLYDNRLIRLHTVKPDGYLDFSSFSASVWPTHIFFPGKRFYLDLEVDNITDSYFIDTGLHNAPVKLPMSRAPQSRRRAASETLSLPDAPGLHDGASMHDDEPVRTDNVWVEVGNRAGSQKAFYADDGEEPYALNPINVFTQDMLIDFQHSCIDLRPYVAKPRRQKTVTPPKPDSTYISPAHSNPI